MSQRYPQQRSLPMTSNEARIRYQNLPFQTNRGLGIPIAAHDGCGITLVSVAIRQQWHDGVGLENEARSVHTKDWILRRRL